MESSTDSGLTVTYDEEAGVIHLDWNPETHPEWNFLEGMTSEEFCQILSDYIKSCDPSTIKAEVCSW